VVGHLFKEPSQSTQSGVYTNLGEPISVTIMGLGRVIVLTDVQVAVVLRMTLVQLHVLMSETLLRAIIPQTLVEAMHLPIMPVISLPTKNLVPLHANRKPVVVG